MELGPLDVAAIRRRSAAMDSEEMRLSPLEAALFDEFQRILRPLAPRLEDQPQLLRAMAQSHTALLLGNLWLEKHPRGHIDIQPDTNGRIVTYSEVHPETGHEDGGTGFGPTLADALIGAFREGE